MQWSLTQVRTLVRSESSGCDISSINRPCAKFRRTQNKDHVKFAWWFIKAFPDGQKSLLELFAVYVALAEPLQGWVDNTITEYELMKSFITFLQKVVFVGPFEHHSNILPWKETGTKVISQKALAETILKWFCGWCHYVADFWVCKWNPQVWPFKWKLLSSTILYKVVLTFETG